jgi:hypothetical protein
VSADPRLRRPTRQLLLAGAAVPLAVLAAALAPSGSRAWVFLAGMAVVAALAIRAGVGGRAALLADTPAKGRAAAIAWLGLVVGVTAAIFCLWSVVGLLA